MQYFQRFQNHDFIGNTKFPTNLLLNFFSVMVQIVRQTFRKVWRTDICSEHQFNRFRLI